MEYEIHVSQIKYPEYPCFSFYNIDSHAEHDAKRQAKERFQNDTGFKPEDTQAKVINKDQFGRYYKRN
jgi:hypothetical protein